MKKTILTLSVLLTLFLLTACTNSAGNTDDKTGTSSPLPNGTGTVYRITDYYDADGGFSSLGLALDEENSEKVLKASEGDTLIVGDQEYVVVHSLVIPFYTQTSLDEALAWWTAYCESRVERGEMQ